MIDVVIADDHRLVAEGIARMLEDSPAARIVAIAGTAAEAVDALERLKPQVLMLDVALPDADGIDAISQLKAASSQTRILMFTMYGESAVVQRAFDAGATGYLLKSASTSELFEAIEAVASGNVYRCKEVQLCCTESKEAQPALTMREREVLRLIVKGYTIKEISDRLCLGFETVHSYTKYLRQKLGCNNIASLVRIAIEQHLV